VCLALFNALTFPAILVYSLFKIRVVKTYKTESLMLSFLAFLSLTIAITSFVEWNYLHWA
jgi:hypothetical protein